MVILNHEDKGEAVNEGLARFLNLPNQENGETNLDKTLLVLAKDRINSEQRVLYQNLKIGLGEVLPDIEEDIRAIKVKR